MSQIVIIHPKKKKKSVKLSHLLYLKRKTPEYLVFLNLYLLYYYYKIYQKISL